MDNDDILRDMDYQEDYEAELQRWNSGNNEIAVKAERWGKTMSDDIQAKIAAVWNAMDASWESYGKIFEDKATMNAGKVALITDHEQMTYAQLDARVNRVGNALEGLGIQKDDKVCVMLPNIPEFLYVWWGNAKLGGITVPLNTAFKGEGLAYIINHSDAETLVFDHRYLPALEDIRGALTS